MTATPATLQTLRRALDAGEVSSRELVEAALARAEATRATLNAFIGLRPEAARAAAACTWRRCSSARASAAA